MNTRIFRTEVRDELLGIVREPTALVFSVLTPVAFFALFARCLATRARLRHRVCCHDTGHLQCSPRS